MSIVLYFPTFLGGFASLFCLLFLQIDNLLMGKRRVRNLSHLIYLFFSLQQILCYIGDLEGEEKVFPNLLWKGIRRTYFNSTIYRASPLYFAYVFRRVIEIGPYLLENLFLQYVIFWLVLRNCLLLGVLLPVMTLISY